MFLSGHYAGQDLVPKIRGGESWKKVFGPVYIYLNSAAGGYDPLWLWEDAKIMVCACFCCAFVRRNLVYSNYQIKANLN